jgi:hypothetical protein
MARIYVERDDYACMFNGVERVNAMSYLVYFDLPKSSESFSDIRGEYPTSEMEGGLLELLKHSILHSFRDAGAYFRVCVRTKYIVSIKN